MIELEEEHLEVLFQSTKEYLDKFPPFDTIECQTISYIVAQYIFNGGLTGEQAVSKDWLRKKLGCNALSERSKINLDGKLRLTVEQANVVVQMLREVDGCGLLRNYLNYIMLEEVHA